jgi:hypothetical protein
MKYRVTLYGKGGKLDVRVVDTQEETRTAVLDIADGIAYFDDGDKIVVTEVEE